MTHCSLLDDDIGNNLLQFVFTNPLDSGQITKNGQNLFKLLTNTAAQSILKLDLEYILCILCLIAYLVYESPL